MNYTFLRIWIYLLSLTFPRIEHFSLASLLRVFAREMATGHRTFNAVTIVTSIHRQGVQILDAMNYNYEYCHQIAKAKRKINLKKENNALNLQLVYCQAILLSK